MKNRVSQWNRFEGPLGKHLLEFGFDARGDALVFEGSALGLAGAFGGGFGVGHVGRIGIFGKGSGSVGRTRRLSTWDYYRRSLSWPAEDRFVALLCIVIGDW